MVEHSLVTQKVVGSNLGMGFYMLDDLLSPS